MNVLPRSLGVRIVMALAAAVAGIVGLSFCVERADAAARDTAPSLVPAVVDVPRITFSLAPCGGSILLASRTDAIAPGIAPLIQVFADGSVALRRPSPLAHEPGATTIGDAAIVLPAPLPRLDASARGALLELVGRLVGERPLPLARLRLVDIAASERDLAVLADWVR